VIRLYLDEDSMARAVLRGLRAAGFDVLTTTEAGMRGRPDPDQLAFGASRRRVIYTANIGDYSRLHAESWVEWFEHAGIVVLTEQRLSPGEQIRRLVRLSAEVGDDGMVHRIEFLGDFG
jgi:beta-phosphoglucomutase-like phosphatase (HAD superfamily)